jgi:hypothetical protein
MFKKGFAEAAQQQQNELRTLFMDSSAGTE